MADDTDCPICFYRMLTPTVLVPCGHMICGVCVLKLTGICWICKANVSAKVVPVIMRQQLLVGASDDEIARHTAALSAQKEVAAPVRDAGQEPETFADIVRSFDSIGDPTDIRSAELEIVRHVRASVSHPLPIDARISRFTASIECVMTNSLQNCRVAAVFQSTSSGGGTRNCNIAFLPRSVVMRRIIVTDITVLQARSLSDRQGGSCMLRMYNLHTIEPDSLQRIQIDYIDQRGLSESYSHYSMDDAVRRRPWMIAKQLHWIFLTNPSLYSVPVSLWNGDVQRLCVYYRRNIGGSYDLRQTRLSRERFYELYAWILPIDSSPVSNLDRVRSMFANRSSEGVNIECFVLVQGIACE